MFDQFSQPNKQSELNRVSVLKLVHYEQVKLFLDDVRHLRLFQQGKRALFEIDKVEQPARFLAFLISLQRSGGKFKEQPGVLLNVATQLRVFLITLGGA